MQLVGQRWARLPPGEKQRYVDLAARVRKQMNGDGSGTGNGGGHRWAAWAWLGCLFMSVSCMGGFVQVESRRSRECPGLKVTVGLGTAGLGLAGTGLGLVLIILIITHVFLHSALTCHLP